MLERRKSIRGKTFLGGSIAFHERKSTMDCLVRNLSPEGAKLSFDDVSAIPGEFELTITRRDRSFRARTIWRRGEEAGIVFVSEAMRAGTVSLDAERRLRKAEAERLRLKQRIAELTGGA